MHQEFDPRDLEPSLPARESRAVRSKVAPIMIALVALAGFGGVVWYAYDQGIRQAATPGSTPLIKADNAPIKVRPDQPGGLDVPHQDTMVLNSLPQGDKEPPVERLLPPAETPLPRPAATAPAANASLPPKIGPAPTPTTAPAAVTPVIPAPLASAPPAPAAPTTPPTQIAAAAPLPPAAPAPPAAAPRAPVQIAAAAAPPKPVASPVAGAGYRVRLVSVKQESEAKQEWTRLQQHFPQLAALQMSVTRADLGEKGVWYRIHAGPLSDAAAASQLCASIEAKDKSQGCLVVKP
jgi:hypothetical protein